MVISVEEARAYAHDDTSSGEEMEALITVAESMISDAVGAGFDRADPGAKMLAKLFVADLDDVRALSAPAANARRDLVSSLILQLRVKTDAKAGGAPDGT